MTTPQPARWLLTLSILAAACGGGGGVGEEQVGEVVSDTSVMQEATAAANEIIRNQADCEMVQSRYREVDQKLEELSRQVQTAAGRTSFDSLRRQVDNIANACGAR